MRILYIDVDALRPDRLGCYGYHRNTSPHMDRIAAEGVRFDQCYTSDAPCLPSRTALYTGRFGIQTGLVGHGHTAASLKNEGMQRGFRDLLDREGLVHELRRAGFYTTMISTFAERHAAWHILAGFNEIHNIGKGGEESAEEIDPVLFPWLERNATSDHWYLHVNFWDAHTPYRTPMEYGEPFADDPLPAHLDDVELIRRHNQQVGPHGSLEINMFNDQEDPRFPRQPGKVNDLASMRRLVDGYDTGIRYLDERIGRIVDHLKAAGVYDDTAILISADHGENFGELGVYAEHATADVATCRVPLIIKWPGMKSGSVNTGLHYSLDLAPTIAGLLGRDPCPSWSGESFAPALQGDETAGRDQVVLSQCAHVCQRSVRWDRWLYIRTYHCGFHLYPDEMLFDIVNDPYEQIDVADPYPDRTREGASRLMNWVDHQMQQMIYDKQDPLWTVMHEGGPFHAVIRPGHSPLPEYLEFLKRTGRTAGADALRAKYGRALRYAGLVE